MTRMEGASWSVEAAVNETRYPLFDDTRGTTVAANSNAINASVRSIDSIFIEASPTGAAATLTISDHAGTAGKLFTVLIPVGTMTLADLSPYGLRVNGWTGIRIAIDNASTVTKVRVLFTCE